MKVPPKVSVVIATYNRAGLLGETLDTVRQQEFEDFEVIVVDDGSTGDTKKCCAPTAIEFGMSFRRIGDRRRRGILESV